MKNFNKAYNIILSITFIAFIATISLLNIFNPTKKFSTSENRSLQQKPKLSVEHVLNGSFSKDFESYLSDQFFRRDDWVCSKSSIEKAIGKKDNNGVYLGKNGYLLQTFNGKDEKLYNKVEAINSFAAANKDVKINFMLVPNSVKVMSDELPKYASPDNELEYINKVKNNLNPSISFIDTNKALMKKNKEYIYYKTDHHWTTKGAYYAYKEASKSLGFVPHELTYFDINKVTDSFYGTLYSKSGFRDIKPDSMEFYIPKTAENYNIKFFDNNKETSSLYNREALKNKDKYAAFLDGNHSLIHIRTDNKNGKSILIVKDSYANSFVPFLTGHYSDIYLVDFRFYYDSLGQFVKEKSITDMLILYNVNSFLEDTGIESIGD